MEMAQPGSIHQNQGSSAPPVVLGRETRHLLGKAIHHYRLIEDGDRIAVAVSGGKDSLLLLWLLRERLKWIPARYTLVAVHVDPGFGGGASEALRDFFHREGFEHRIIQTDHGPRAHSEENRENPCFLCSRLRRRVLFETAREMGCGKIALGHHQDDLIETFMINMLYGGQMAGIVPRQPFFGGKLIVIRPLALLAGRKVEQLARRLDLPVTASACPSASTGKRIEVRRTLEALYASNAKVRGNIFHAMSSVNLEYLPPPLHPSGRGAGSLLDLWLRQAGPGSDVSFRGSEISPQSGSPPP
ncbi:MAG: tRNA 2-thiocytidine(32) synthetase TtcA [Syntrophobacteraceae bacterium]|jgi:tRNA 2-thiocytidine biosynthesis protein TtcA|nr:tRNA 2-thiocytidine(32) synthetase TtcA [Syntrophobacteraceae bacterium]